MEIILLGIAVVMQLQIRCSEMAGPFDMDTVAAVLHLNVVKSDIVTARFFASGRVAGAVEKQANLISAQILTVRALIKRTNQFYVGDRQMIDRRGDE